MDEFPSENYRTAATEINPLQPLLCFERFGMSTCTFPFACCIGLLSHNDEQIDL